MATATGTYYLETAARSLGTYGKHQGYIKYTISQTDTTYTINVTAMGEHFTSTSSSSGTYTSSGSSTVKYTGLSSDYNASQTNSGTRSATVSSSSGKYISFGAGKSRTYTLNTESDRTITLEVSWTWNGTTTTKSVTITLPALKQYTVTASSSNGTIKNDSSNSWTVASDAHSATKKIYHGKTLGNVPSCTRDNYTRNGWWTSSTYISGTQYTSSSTITSNVTIYPHWKPWIYLDANGGTIEASDNNYWESSGSKVYKIKEPEDKLGTLPAAKISRTGYSLKGWFTSKTGSTTVDSNTIIGTSTDTYYAQWNANTYTIVFNGNGSTSGSMSNLSMTYGTAKNLTSNAFVKTGYTFQGWSTSPSATTATYSNSQSVSNLTSTNNGTINLYAVWKINTYTLTANASDGTIPATTGWTGSGNTATKSVTYDTAYGTLPTPTRTGYTFNGWYTASSGGTKVDTTTKIGAANTTIYAQWTVNGYTVSFNANGGIGTVNSITTNASGTFTLPSNGFSKTGYDFVGWSTNNTSTNGTTAGSSVTVSSNTTYYAIWKKTITITYNLNGLKATAPNSNSTTVYNATSTASFTLSTPTSITSGYNFIGWSTSASATTASYKANTTQTFSANTTLYAVSYRAFSITKDKGNYSNAVISGSNPITTNIYNNSSVSINPGTATLSKYTFNGWSIIKNGTASTVYTGSDLNPTLYAIFEPIYNSPIFTILAQRTTSDGEIDDEGTYCKITVTKTGAGYYGDTTIDPDLSNNSVTVITKMKESTDASYTEISDITWTKQNNTFVSSVIKLGDESQEKTFNLQVNITIQASDTKGSGTTAKTSTTSQTISLTDNITTTKYVIDINANGDAIGFFKIAPDSGSEYKENTIYLPSNSLILGAKASLFTSRQNSANLTVDGRVGLSHFLATSTMTTAKPEADGHIIHMAWDNTGGFDSQLYVRNNATTPTIQVRSQTSGTWGNWQTVYTTAQKPTPADIGALPSTGTAITADKLTGFSSRSATMTWGNQTGSVITCFGTTNNGGWGFRDNNPTSGQASMVIDGTIYIKEGVVNVGDAIKSITRSANTFTYTTLWGNTGTFTQNYPSNATTSAAGLMTAADKTKLDAIGTVKSTSLSEAKNITSSGVAMVSLSLEAGTWLIIGTVQFPANATAGYRRVNISTTSGSTSTGNSSNAGVTATASNIVTVQAKRIVQPTSTTTYYVNACANVTISTSYAFAYAVRLK